MKPGGGWALAGVGIAGGLIVSFLVYSAINRPVVCSASALYPTVQVRIVGDASAVHDVRLCTSGGCSEPALAEMERDVDPGDEATMATPETGTTPSPGAGVDPAIVYRMPEKPTGPEIPAPTAPPATKSKAGVTAPDVPAPRFGDLPEQAPRRWIFTTGGSYPTRVSVFAYGADGHLVATKTAHLTWRPESAVCSPGDVTGPVTLHVGS